MTVDPVNSVDPAGSLDSVASVPPVASTGLLAIEPEAIEPDLNQTDLNQSDASEASQPSLAQGALDHGRSPVDPERPGLAAEPLASGSTTEPSIAADPTADPVADLANAAVPEVTPLASPTRQPSEPELIELPAPAAPEPTPPEPAPPEPPAPLASAAVAPADLPELPPEDPPEIRQALERLARLRDERDRLRSDILAGRAMMSQIVEAGLVDLDRRRRTLEATIEQLERRQTKLRQEIEATFAGKSQDIAARVQGFKDYLVGSLQELAAAAEELAVPAPATRSDEIEQRPNERPDRPAGRSPERPGDRLDRPDRPINRPTTGRYDDRPSRQREPNPDPMDNAAGRSASRGSGWSGSGDSAQPASVGRSPDRRDRRDRTPEPIRPQFAASQFQDEQRKIQQWLERYRSQPDYYGPPWKLRRTFEAVHAERATTWFFELGGRGALRSLGSRLQNILVAAATVSILRALYGDRLHLLILVDSPERLGDWRRGLQDCLGLARSDFGIDRGVTIFEAPEPMAQRADRLWRNGDLPFILFDESDGRVSLSLLQFPLWLAFAPEPRPNPREDYYL